MKIVKKCGTTLPNPYNWLKKTKLTPPQTSDIHWMLVLNVDHMLISRKSII
jgi:hypothetical protein